MRLVKKPTVKDCAGCRNDFYNGKNDIGVSRCWCLEKAVMISALDIPVDLRPPYKGMKPTIRPDCYKRDRFVRVKKDQLTPSGFRK